MQYRWSNRATQDFAEWLVEDVVGIEMARQLCREPMTDDTPVMNLAAKLRGIIQRSLPIPMDPDWMAEVNWVEVAAYLVDNLELDDDE